MQDLQKIIFDTAAQLGVDGALAIAIAEAESGLNTYAARYEPVFRYTNEKAERPRISSIQTEIQHQKTSWGLMQVMGIVARELGFKGWLTELTIPETGAKFGIMHLKSKLEKYGSQGIEAAVSAYNAGQPLIDRNGFRNQVYVDRVLKNKAKWESQFGRS